MSQGAKKFLAVLIGVALPVLGLGSVEVFLFLSEAAGEPVLERVITEHGESLSRMLPPPPRGAMTPDRLEAALPKPEGTYRILVVGESTAAGFPWYPWFSFGRILEQRLRECGALRPVEVVNFARAADSSDRVRDVALAALEADPDLLLICAGHNDYQVPYEQDLRAGIGAAWRRFLRRSRLIQVVHGPPTASLVTAPRLPADRLLGAEPFLDEAERARGVERFQANLEAVLDACERAGVPCVLLTQAANLSSFPPSYSSFSTLESAEQQQTYELRLEQAMQQVAAGAVSASTERELASLRDQDGGVALVHFLQGQVWEQAGRIDEAGPAFDRALGLDTYPNRATPAFNQLIRRMDAREAVQVLDAAAAFARWSSKARPGHDLFLDHCHPTVEATFRLAEFVLQGLRPRLVKAGVMTDEQMVSRDPTDAQQRAALMAAMGVEQAALAEMTFAAGRLNLLAWLEAPANQGPLALAESAFRISLSVVPEHTEALAGLVALHLVRGQREQALAMAARATRTDPTALALLETLCQSHAVLQAALDQTGLQFVSGQLVDKL